MKAQSRTPMAEYRLYLLKDYLKMNSLPHWVGVDLSIRCTSKHNNHLPIFFISSGTNNINVMRLKKSDLRFISPPVWGINCPSPLFGDSQEENEWGELNDV